MPNPADDDLDLFEGDADADAEEAAAESPDTNESEVERRKLQSERDKERARANKLEAELRKLQEQAPKGIQPAPKGDLPPDVAVWLASAKEAARERWFNSDPRFSRYGLDVALVDGETPDAMQASAKRLSSLIDAIESKTRDSILAEHGISPAPAGGGSTALPDFMSMKDDDFDKLVASVTGRR